MDVNCKIGPIQTPMPEVGKIGWMTDYINDAVSKGAAIKNIEGGKTFKQ
jgi:hypothetical protein